MKMRFIRRTGVGAAIFILAALTLISAMAFSGITFAWFVNRADVPAEDFTMANLGMEYIHTSLNVKNFQETPYAIQSHLELVSALKSGNPETASMDWVKNNSNNNEIFANAEKASLNCMVSREYTLVNKSDIPVYFRINKAEMSGDHPEIILTAMYGIESGERGLLNGELIPGDTGDDWLYCEEPLYPDDTITITFAAYIISIDGGTLATFSADFAEIIQVPNNALYMSDGWKYAAEKFEIAVNASE